MSRSGRKRKPGQREPNGRLQRPTVDRLNAIAAQQRQKEQQTVLDQPHRRGSEHKWNESPVGRLALRHKLRQELVDAGESYALVVNRWRGCWGAPRAVGTPQETRGGEGPTMAAADRLRKQMIQCERAMDRAGGADAIVAVHQLVLVVADTAPEQDHSAITGLHALAVDMGLIRENDRIS